MRPRTQILRTALQQCRCRPSIPLPRVRGHSTSSRPDYLPLSHFLQSASTLPNPSTLPTPSTLESQVSDPPPYLAFPSTTPQSYHIESYGCQMNFADADLVNAILQSHNFHPTPASTAQILLLVTCAIRENAEQKIWRRLEALQPLRQRGGKVAVLGCMAERLKFKLLEGERLVDVVCGPDAYRDLPFLLGKEGGVGNVMLSVDETYADIMPVQIESDRVSACLSIMRGCNNMCSYCIVPFTRGKERSRPVESILREVKHMESLGIKQITLLGQNVNSYRDLTTSSTIERNSLSSPDFKPIYKYQNEGFHFLNLLDTISKAAPGILFRFTSAHPQFFPLPLLQLIASRPNIAKQVHLPAQSGSSTVLERMRRGYTREAYLSLAHRIRAEIPNVTLSSDFIVGFCGETEREFEDTLSLAEEVKYETSFNFMYSLREKTKAHRMLVDDVPQMVKKERLVRLNEVYERGRIERLDGMVGREEIVLVEGKGEKEWKGRNSGGIRVNVEGELPGQEIEKGDFVKVKTTRRQNGTLIGHPLEVVTL